LCLVLSTTSDEGREVIESFGGSLIGVPLPDVSKIHSGTIDEVLSKGWSIPFSQEQAAKKSNATEMINHWERIIIVDFTPELGGMKEESDLLEVVNIITNDIQDMGEVGWYQKMDAQEKLKYSLEESIIDIPSLQMLHQIICVIDSGEKFSRMASNQSMFAAQCSALYL